MKVLISVPHLDMPGGVANYYRILRYHLGDDIRYFEVGERPRESSGIAKIPRFVADFWKFHRELAGGDYDLVHLNPSLATYSVIREGVLILIAKLHRRRLVVFFRGWDASCERSVSKYFRWLFSTVYGRADAFIVLGEVFEKSLRSLGIKAPVFRETTVVDDSIFSAANGLDSDRKAGSAPVDVLYLSRLVAGKGLRESIEAFALLQARIPDCRLVVAGAGPGAEEARQLVADLGLSGVRFVGHVTGEAKREEFMRADIFLFPTFYGEGIPNGVLEAMAFGLPVITRAVGGLPDFFENERMGFITDSRDNREFARLLETLDVDPGMRMKMGRYNREFARERFAASEVARRLLDIYARI
ncbi:MAG: glycosyltransferase family 4 protein [Woeseiaceae bacterium]